MDSLINALEISETIQDAAGDVRGKECLHFVSLVVDSQEEREGEEGWSVVLNSKVIILLFGRNYPHQSYKDAQLPEGIW